MKEPIVVKEYSEIDVEDCNLDKLHDYLKCQKLDSALKVTRHGIETTSWVGVIKYKNTHFQILPKLIYTEEYNEKDDRNKNIVKSQILKNLIYMLSYTKRLDIKTGSETKLSASKNPFIEILIREYAKSLFECLKRLTPKQYIREEDNLNFIKGKIKFSDNIKHNSVNNAKFFCEYDEFAENNELNKLFLFVSSCLYNISNDSYNKKTLKFIINYFSEIDLVRFDKFSAGKIKLTRNQELLKKPFNLAKMFVEQTSVDLSKNKFENITLIWDMNKLFEEFIYEIINKYSEEYNCKITAQRGKKLLIGDNSKKRNTFVDIMIEKNDEKIVLDTKYKKFVGSNSFSNSDVFQVSTYCLLHGAKHAILLYPQWDENKPDVQYHLNNDRHAGVCDYLIDFRTINLKYDYIGKSENLEKIKSEIKNIIELA